MLMLLQKRRIVFVQLIMANIGFSRYCPAACFPGGGAFQREVPTDADPRLECSCGQALKTSLCCVQVCNN
jgi:hypothetical protein